MVYLFDRIKIKRRYDNIIPNSLQPLFRIITGWSYSEYEPFLSEGLLENRIISSHLIFQKVFPGIMTHCWKVLYHLRRDDERFWLPLWYLQTVFTNQSRYVVLVHKIETKSAETILKTNMWSMKYARSLL